MYFGHAVTSVFFCIQLMSSYNVPDFETADEFLSFLAIRHGRLRKGGLPDSEKAAREVLNDWNQ